MLNDVVVCNGVEFKVGDKVRVMRQEEDFAPEGMGEMGKWDNTWCGAESDWLAMDAYLGHTFVIESIEQAGAEFEGSDVSSYKFPLSVLEKVAA